MVEIPPEIWATVASYLPKDTLMRLLSVNRAFYALALDQRYQTFTMNQINGGFLGKLEGLKIDENAIRVRVLHLEPPCLHELASYENLHRHHPPPKHEHHHRITVFASRLFHKLLPITSTEPEEQEEIPSAAEITESLGIVIPKLNQVERFTLCWDSASLFDAPYLSWRTLATHLLHLQLDVHPRFAASRLPNDVEFPCLKTLTFTLCIAEVEETPRTLSKVVDSLAVLINRTSKTLESLYVGSPQKRDIGDLYTRLPRFDHLRAFEICPQTFTNPSPLLAFLQAHSDVLKEIIYVSDSNPNFQNGLSTLEVKQLDKLVMRLHYVPYPTAWWTVQSPFFTSASSTLRVLNIAAAVSIKELVQLLSATQLSVLEEFSVSITSFSVEALVLIAENLRTLKSLDLRIHDVVAKGGFPTTPGDMFPYCATTPHPRQTTPSDLIDHAKATLPSLEWGLQDITIKRRSCCGDLILWGLMELCAECLPSIKSFAKRGSKMVPDPRNVKPPGGNIRCWDFVCSFGGVGEREVRDFSP